MKKKLTALMMVMMLLFGSTGAELFAKNSGKKKGAATGAAVGALLGQVFGKNTKATVVGAAVGAVIGTGVGAVSDKKKNNTTTKKTTVQKTTAQKTTVQKTTTAKKPTKKNTATNVTKVPEEAVAIVVPENPGARKELSAAEVSMGQDGLLYENGKDYPFTGTVRSFYAGGAVESESTWLKGKMDGVARNFYENGVIMSESVWAEGEQWGETTNYLADGTIDKGEAPAAPAAPAEEKPFVVEKPVIVMTEPEHKPAESETVVAETPVTTSEAVVVAAPAATEAVTEKPATRTVLPVIPYDVIPAPDEPQPEKSNLEPKVAANQS